MQLVTIPIISLSSYSSSLPGFMDASLEFYFAAAAPSPTRWIARCRRFWRRIDYMLRTERIWFLTIETDLTLPAF
jgi:hypothetical protein